MDKFIDSIIKEEKDKFRELLPFIDLNDSNSSYNEWTPLIWAIQKNRMWAIEEMFKTKQIINFKKQIDHKLQRTVLHFAAEKGELELVQILINKDILQMEMGIEIEIKSNIQLDINSIDREHSTALFRASKIGASDIVIFLLKIGANPNICNRDEISPLIIASHRGHINVVQQLLKNELTNINLKDERGRTALLVSCAEDRKNVVKALLKCKSINLNATDLQSFNWNCLMWSIYRKNQKILTLLLNYDRKYQMDYFHQDLYGKNSLEMCIDKKLSKKIQQKLRAKYHSVLFKQLLESQLITKLKIPVVVLGVLLVFTY
eukprot:45739_1